MDVNQHIVCQNPESLASFGSWLTSSPLDFSVPLLLLQLSIITISSQLIELCLQPLGQSSVVSQIFGGILFGPSVLGQKEEFGRTFFPQRGNVTLETAATFGIMFFIFSIGVKADPMMMLHPGRTAMVLGLSAMIGTIVLTVPFALILKSYFTMEESFGKSLPFIAASQCLTPFPNVAVLLRELKILNTDLGRLAISTAMLCDLIGMTMTVVLIALAQSGDDPLKSIFSVLSAIFFVLGIVYIIRPILLSFLRRIPSGKTVGEMYIMSTFVGVLAAGFVSEVIGQHFILGPLVLGLVLPEGPPLGAAVISKLEYPIGKILYPTYLTTSGLKTNIFNIQLHSFGIFVLVILFSCMAKVAAVMVSGNFMNMPMLDSFLIGLMLNARGICEIIVFNLWRDDELLSNQGFALCVLSVIVTTAIITPLIKILYDPSSKKFPLKRRTIQHSQKDSDLRILVCIHDQDSVPSFVNLLEASNATEESPISVIAVILIELVGRSIPELIPHQWPRTSHLSNNISGPIINALNQYELYNERCLTVQAFTTISHFDTMHNDICRVALDQNAAIVILPFHKHWEIDGSIGFVNRGIRTLNIKVLENVPCSVGILVDRRVLTGTLSILNTQSIFHIAVIYLGGPDDAESLCYGARMARHRNVTLTLIRFLLFGGDTARERKVDNNLIEEIRRANIGNPNFIYKEEVVKDGVGLASSIRRLENSFDLIMVGRYHQTSQILLGLCEWSECPELGVIGDMLASPDFGSTASVLVVQQQRIAGGKLARRVMKPGVVVDASMMPEPTLSVPVTTPTPALIHHDEPRFEIAIDTDLSIVLEKREFELCT